jgi:hypothetical protein
MEMSIQALRAAGIVRGDRVALVLPNGPEIASAVLSVASCSACAPLNPRYRESEFELLLSNLGPKAIIVDDDETPLVVDVARRMGTPIIRLVRAAAAYVPQPYPGPITLLEAATQPLGFEVGPRFGWATLAAGGFEVRTVPGAHERLLEEVNLDGFAAELSGCIQVTLRPAKIVLAKADAT